MLPPTPKPPVPPSPKPSPTPKPPVPPTPKPPVPPTPKPPVPPTPVQCDDDSRCPNGGKCAPPKIKLGRFVGRMLWRLPRFMKDLLWHVPLLRHFVRGTCEVKPSI